MVQLNCVPPSPPLPCDRHMRHARVLGPRDAAKGRGGEAREILFIRYTHTLLSKFHCYFYFHVPAMFVCGGTDWNRSRGSELVYLDFRQYISQPQLITFSLLANCNFLLLFSSPFFPFFYFLFFPQLTGSRTAVWCTSSCTGYLPSERTERANGATSPRWRKRTRTRLSTLLSKLVWIFKTLWIAVYCCCCCCCIVVLLVLLLTLLVLYCCCFCCCC